MKNPMMNQLTKTFARKSFLCALLAGVATAAYAQMNPIASGDVIIYRVGDGSASLGTSAASVWLDEYTSLGALVQSYELPTSGSGAFSAVGNATTEGIISLSQDGSSLIFTGYRKAVGGTSPSSDTYLVTPRVIGTLTAAGTFSTPTTMTNDNGATTANTIRSATSIDGTSAFWVSTSSRISYLGSPTPNGASTTQIDPRNSRQINLFGNTLYAANGSTAISAKVQSYGTLPTGATAPSSIVSLTTADAINGFVLFNVANNNPGGADTLYALSTVASQLLKYSYNGSAWVADGSLSTTASDVTGYVNGNTVDLFLTSGSTLYGEVDSSGFGNTINGTITTLATAGSNEAFRGIGMFIVPVPEPSVFGLGAVAAALVALRRRRA